MVMRVRFENTHSFREVKFHQGILGLYGWILRICLIDQYKVVAMNAGCESGYSRFDSSRLLIFDSCFMKLVFRSSGGIKF